MVPKYRSPVSMCARATLLFNVSEDQGDHLRIRKVRYPISSPLGGQNGQWNR